MVSHQQDGLQRLMDKLSDACDLFSLTISQKKTQVMGQAPPALPCITVTGKELEVAHQFQYLGSTTTDILSLDVELSKHIGKASTTLSKLANRVWENKHLTIPTKVNVYKACIISTLLYSSESWTTYSTQEEKLLVFHLRCLHRILGITWQDKVWKKWCSLKSWCPIHVHAPMTMPSTLAGPHSQDGRWVYPQGSPSELATGARCRGHPYYASRIDARMTWKHATLTLSHGKPLQMTELCGSNKCHMDRKEGRLPSKKEMMKDGPGEQPVISRTTKTHIKHQSSHARVATEIANPGLASTATQDDAHQQPLRMLPHSQSTVRCQQPTLGLTIPI